MRSEPVVDVGEALFGEMQAASVAGDCVDAEDSADGVAETDAAPASGESGEVGGDGMQIAFEDLVAAEDQQGFIGDRQTDNAQHEEHEDGRVSVGGGNPVLEELKHFR